MRYLFVPCVTRVITLKTRVVLLSGARALREEGNLLWRVLAAVPDRRPTTNSVSSAAVCLRVLVACVLYNVGVRLYPGVRAVGVRLYGRRAKTSWTKHSHLCWSLAAVAVHPPDPWAISAIPVLTPTMAETPIQRQQLTAGPKEMVAPCIAQEMLAMLAVRGMRVLITMLV